MTAYERLPLNALRVFEAVATRLNFGEAAEALHVTPAAVSQQIKTLEDYLQTPLFRRDGRRVQLTAEGAQLLPGIRHGLDELEATLQGLRQERKSGTVNVSTLASFLQRWLMPRLGGFRAVHPDIELRLHTSSTAVDFARTDFHAAVRFGLGRYGELRTEKIMDDWLVAVAAPSVIAKHGALPGTGDLAQYPLLHGDELDWANWSTGDTRSMSALRGAFIDDTVSLLTACMEGMGFALMRWTIAASELQAGRIALASEHVVPHRFAYYFVCPQDYATFPKVAALREWLMQQGREFAKPPMPTAAPAPRQAAAKAARPSAKGSARALDPAPPAKRKR
ncbi:MAG: LysR family transcriptional regulator, glycine cleavage system transcriptional activator [Gammaproteobacteria bacterium]|nr:LysR family transcriptional regulator, glycine cleavage system transcriptional activator [Gammaproteobacteria bacterium]